MLVWNEKWKVGQKMGSRSRLCYIQIGVITDRVVARCRCIILSVEVHVPVLGMVSSFIVIS